MAKHDGLRRATGEATLHVCRLCGGGRRIERRGLHRPKRRPFETSRQTPRAREAGPTTDAEEAAALPQP